MRFHERLILLCLPLATIPLAILAFVLLYVGQARPGGGILRGDEAELAAVLFVAAIGVVTLLMIRRVARTVAEPLRASALHIQALARGERDIPIKVEGADGEMKDLVEGLERLRVDLVTYEERLKRRSADEAMGRLAAQVAHDIRSPASILKAFSSRIAPAEGEEDGEEDGELYRRTVDKLLGMAGDLLDVSKAHRIERREADLAALVRCSISACRARMGKGAIELRYAGPDELLADVDAEKMDRVITNLVQNAAEAIPPGAHGTVEVGLAEEEGAARIAVADDGQGITADGLARLFERYYTTKGRNGNGLGLAYCKDVIEGHGGEIEVESEVGKGTRFIVTLPRVNVN